MSLADDNLIGRVPVSERTRFAVRVLHTTRKQCRSAGSASTISAAIGQADTPVQGSIEDGFTGFNGKMMLTVLDPDEECHAAFQSVV